MKVIGLSAFYHDSAACLIKDGRVISAIEEERITRVKHDHSFPRNALKAILEQNHLTLENIDYVVFHEKPLLKFERVLNQSLVNVPNGFNQFEYALRKWLGFDLHIKSKILKELKKIGPCSNFSQKKLLFNQHHYSHAASSYYTSPFSDACVLVVDGVGEWASVSMGTAKGHRLQLEKQINYPHSLGLLYSVFTAYCGFKINSGEYKLMGLAPYGKPKFYDLIVQEMISLHEDGSFKLNLKYFSFHNSLNAVATKMEQLFGRPKREVDDQSDRKIDSFYADVACSVQKVLETAMVNLAKQAKAKYKGENLCLSGGVALNCVANKAIKDAGLFKNIWIQPAGGDSGAAIGAALYTYFDYFKNSFSGNEKYSTCLGPAIEEKEIKEALVEKGLHFRELEESELLDTVVTALNEQKIVGWFQGQMEFGPRALGMRSILADPRDPRMKEKLNLKVKYREPFRPFAPVILSESFDDYFNESSQRCPYMLFTAQAKDEAIKKLGAAIHVDGTARVQCLKKQDNERLHKLLSKFHLQTGCPALINTSFNVRGEPIVYSADHAIDCFLNAQLDYLIIDNFIVTYEDNADKRKRIYFHED